MDHNTNVMALSPGAVDHKQFQHNEAIQAPTVVNMPPAEKQKSRVGVFLSAFSGCVCMSAGLALAGYSIYQCYRFAQRSEYLRPLIGTAALNAANGLLLVVISLIGIIAANVSNRGVKTRFTWTLIWGLCYFVLLSCILCVIDGLNYYLIDNMALSAAGAGWAIVCVSPVIIIALARVVRLNLASKSLNSYMPNSDQVQITVTEAPKTRIKEQIAISVLSVIYLLPVALAYIGVSLWQAVITGRQYEWSTLNESVFNNNWRFAVSVIHCFNACTFAIVALLGAFSAFIPGNKNKINTMLLLLFGLGGNVIMFVTLMLVSGLSTSTPLIIYSAIVTGVSLFMIFIVMTLAASNIKQLRDRIASTISITMTSKDSNV